MVKQRYRTAILSPDLFRTYEKLGREYGLPLLLERRPGTYRPNGQTPAPYTLVDQVVTLGTDVAPEDWMRAYKDKLKPLPPGVYELIVHTGYDDDEMRGATAGHSDWGAAWRQRDLELLKSPDFRHFLRDEGFILTDWKDLAKTLPADYAPRPDTGVLRRNHGR